jgi:hypothetical protein
MANRQDFAAVPRGIVTDESAQSGGSGQAAGSRWLAIRADATSIVPNVRPASACLCSIRENAIENREQGMRLDDTHADDRAVTGLPPAGVPDDITSETLTFIDESLQILAGATPAKRVRLQPMKASIVLAWQKYSEATASALEGAGSPILLAPACRDPGQAMPIPATWAATTLDRMSVDVPLWSCTIALLRASILVGCSTASAPGAGRSAPGHHRSGVWSGFLSALDALPFPFGVAACALREQLAPQLCSGASSAVLEGVFDANALLSPQERPLACWIPCLLGLEAMHRSGRAAPCSAALLYFINENAKQQLSKLLPSIATTWLVGRDPYERGAAARPGVHAARNHLLPRISESPPRFGRYLVAGIGEPSPLGEVPANCLGMADLLAEARQNDALARAASLCGSDGTGMPATTGRDGLDRSWRSDGIRASASSGYPTSCPARSDHD